MVKSLKKASKFKPSTIKPTSPINALTKRKILAKSKQQIDKEYYQKNKEKKQAERKERYQEQKKQTKSTAKQGLAKYYKAENIRVLMSLKEYTELNQEKKKKWLNFIWTFKDLNEVGFHSIIQIMKIREEAENLINDYWETAEGEVKKGKSWNIVSEEQQQKLIKYWGREKARIENNYLTEAERLEKQSQAYLKEIELAKFHEERGKIKCECYQCEAQKEIQAEVKVKIKEETRQAEKELDDYWGANEKIECSECGRKVKELDEESGLCKTCWEKYE